MNDIDINDYNQPPFEIIKRERAAFALLYEACAALEGCPNAGLVDIMGIQKLLEDKNLISKGNEIHAIRLENGINRLVKVIKDLESEKIPVTFNCRKMF